MPFTPAHVDIILPLNYLPKKYISLSALVIGSMVPDFEYFIRMKPYSIYSHTLAGLFWYDVPLGFLVLILFDQFVRNPLIDHLPNFLNKRLSMYKDIHVKPTLFRIIIISLCLLTGSSSHLLWDSFTHETGYFVAGSNLSHTINLAGFTLPIFKILQHSSTVAGFLIIAYSIVQLPPGMTTNFRNILPFWVTTTTITFLILGIRIATGLNITEYGSIIVTTISGFLVGLLITSVYSHKENIPAKF